MCEERYHRLLDALLDAWHQPQLTRQATESAEWSLPGLVGRPWRRLAFGGDGVVGAGQLEHPRQTTAGTRSASTASGPVTPSRPSPACSAARRQCWHVRWRRCRTCWASTRTPPSRPTPGWPSPTPIRTTTRSRHRWPALRAGAGSCSGRAGIVSGRVEGGIAAQTDGVDALNPEDARPAEADVVDGLAGARIHAAGGVVWRRRTRRHRGGAGAPAALRRLVLAQGQAQAKRASARWRGARGARGDWRSMRLLGPRLPPAQYDVWAGDALVEKVVDYWAMTRWWPGRASPPATRWTSVAWLPVDTGSEPADLSTRPARAARPRRAARHYADRWSDPARPAPASVLTGPGRRRATADDSAGARRADAARPTAGCSSALARLVSRPRRCAASRRWSRSQGAGTGGRGRCRLSTRTAEPGPGGCNDCAGLPIRPQPSWCAARAS